MRRAILFVIILFTLIGTAVAACTDELLISHNQLADPFEVRFDMDVTAYASCEGVEEDYAAVLWTLDYGDGNTESWETPTPFTYTNHIYTSYGTYQAELWFELLANPGEDAGIRDEIIPYPLDLFAPTLSACVQDDCTPVSAACDCAGTQADPGEYCYDDAVHTSQKSSITCTPPPPPPGSTQCPISACDPILVDCVCGSTDASAGEYCIAPDTVQNTQGVCNERPTNVIVTAGNIHLCGPVWVDVDPSVVEHQLCDEIETIIEYTYTCSVNASGWWWFRKDQSVPFIDRTNQSILEHADPSLIDYDLTACVNGEQQQAVVKYSPPPKLKEGACGTGQCFTGEGCVDVGTNRSGYMCRDYDDGAWWVSGVVRAAEAVMQYANGQYLLNCGPKKFSVNLQEGTPLEMGYCQLAEVSGGEAEKIYIAIALDDESDGGSTFIKSELLRVHTEEELECLDEEPEDCDFLDIDTDLGVVVFTDDNSLQPTGFAAFWDWLSGIFVQNPQLTLKTKAADKLFVYTPDNVERAAEYVVGTDCASKQEIIGADKCFTTRNWRREIQQR